MNYNQYILGKKGRQKIIEVVEEMEREHAGLGEAIKTVKRMFHIEETTIEEKLENSRRILEKYNIDGSLVDSLIKERREEAEKESREEVPLVVMEGTERDRNKWSQLLAKGADKGRKTNTILARGVDSHTNEEILPLILEIIEDSGAISVQGIADRLKEDGITRRDSNFNRLIGSLCYGLRRNGEIEKDESGDYMMAVEDDDE